MKLDEWMERTGKRASEIAAALGCSVETVRRYANGLRIPDRNAMPAIVSFTGGEVTANDFYDLELEHGGDDTPDSGRHSAGKFENVSRSEAA